MEFALTVPVLIAMVLGVIQYSVMMFTYNSMLNGARSGARALAIGARNADEVTADVRNSLPAWVPKTGVTVVARDTAETGTTQVDATVTIDASDATILSLLPMPAKLQAKAVMIKES